MKYSTQRRLIKKVKGVEVICNHPDTHDTVETILRLYKSGQIQLMACAIEDAEGSIHCMWSGDDVVLKRLGLSEMLKQDIYRVDVVEEFHMGE